MAIPPHLQGFIEIVAEVMAKDYFAGTLRLPGESLEERDARVVLERLAGTQCKPCEFPEDRDARVAAEKVATADQEAQKKSPPKRPRKARKARASAPITGAAAPASRTSSG